MSRFIHEHLLLDTRYTLFDAADTELDVACPLLAFVINAPCPRYRNRKREDRGTVNP